MSYEDFGEIDGEGNSEDEYGQASDDVTPTIEDIKKEAREIRLNTCGCIEKEVCQSCQIWVDNIYRFIDRAHNAALDSAIEVAEKQRKEYKKHEMGFPYIMACSEIVSSLKTMKINI